MFLTAVSERVGACNAGGTDETRTAKILSDFMNLTMDIAKNLMDINVNMDDFQKFVLALFEAGSCSIPESSDVFDTFNTLSTNKYWDHLDVSGLEETVEEFSGVLKDTNMTMIMHYKERLATYKAATSIADIVKFSRQRTSEEKSDSGLVHKHHRVRMSVQLPSSRGFNLEQPVSHLDQLWNSISLQFGISPLLQPLESIEESMSVITIHWIIRTALAKTILEGIGEAGEFLERQGIARVSLEGFPIYDQDSGGIPEKEARFSIALCSHQATEFCLIDTRLCQTADGDSRKLRKKILSRLH